MTAPVHNQQPVSQPQASDPVPARVPAGVGAVPSTMQGQPQPQQEKGYIERMVVAIRDFILMIFSKIFSYCKKPEPPPPAATEPQQQPQGPDIRTQHQEILNKLKSTLRSEDLLRFFDAYFPSEAEKAPIYLRLGQAAPLSFAQSIAHNVVYTDHYSREQKIQIGKRMVEKEPTLLIPHLIHKLETITIHRG